MSSDKHLLLIKDYFDSLVKKVDVYTEDKLKIYSNGHFIDINEEKDETHDTKEFALETATDLLSEETEEKVFSSDSVKDKPLSDLAIKINWPQKKPFEMKAHEYLNFMRDEMIKHIKISEKETLEYYESIRDGLGGDNKIKDEELKRKLFGNGSAVLCSRPHSNKNPFTLYLLLLDFYMDKRTYQSVFDSNDIFIFDQVIH